MKPIRYKAINEDGNWVEGWYLETIGKDNKRTPTIFNDEKFYPIDRSTLEVIGEDSADDNNIVESVARMQRELDTYYVAVLALYKKATTGETVIAPMFEHNSLLNRMYRVITQKIQAHGTEKENQGESQCRLTVSKE